MLRLMSWSLTFVLGLGLTACSQDHGTDQLIRLVGETMGTTYSIKYPSHAGNLEPPVVQQHIDRILERINARMSTYREDSELTLFNKTQSTEWMMVSAETTAVVKEAIRLSRMTDGSFDVTVAPLVNLWGFGSSVTPQDVPTHEAIREALQTVGYQRIHVQDSPSALRKEDPAVQIDLSAIAKGYAVDQVAEYLDSVNMAHYLVEIGGELRSKGYKAQDIAWKVAIEKPVTGGRTVFRVLELQDHAMATSGDYRNFFERQGERFSHTIDPKTGRPTTHHLASVTVLNQSCMWADALATGLMVLGTEAGYELARREKLPALFITRSEHGYRERATPEIEQFLVG